MEIFDKIYQSQELKTLNAKSVFFKSKNDKSIKNFVRVNAEF